MASKIHQDRSVPTARAKAYAYVLDHIIRGDFRGGDFIEEEWVSSAAGVSRTPVREAFHRLESERFIELLPRRGLARGSAGVRST